jgi:hypothetical protein
MPTIHDLLLETVDHMIWTAYPVESNSGTQLRGRQRTRL